MLCKMNSSWGLITLSFICLCFPSFLWISKLKHPQKKKKTKYQRDVHKFKGEKIMFPNREKDRWKRKKIYLRVLRLRSWSVNMRSLNPWWIERLEIGSRENGDFWDWEWDFDLILRSENRSKMGLNSLKIEACVWILWNSVWDEISISILAVLSFCLLLIWSLLLLIWFLLLQRRL